VGFALVGWHESNFGNKKPSSLNFINGVGSLELNLRHVKTTLGMEMLRGKTPDMVRKGNLRAFDGLQLAAYRDVTGWQKSWSLAGTHFFARHSLTFGTLLP
jgi:hypothetical protein